MEQEKHFSSKKEKKMLSQKLEPSSSDKSIKGFEEVEYAFFSYFHIFHRKQMWNVKIGWHFSFVLTFDK